MEFVPGSIRLDDISGGVLGAGVVPFARFLRGEGSAFNAGLVTITNVLTDVATLTIAGVKSGDRLFCFATVVGSKGATAGITEIHVEPDIGAGVSWQFGNNYFPMERRTQPATEQQGFTMGGIGSVAGNGDLIAKLRGVSLGSNVSVVAQAACIQIFVMAGSQ